MRHGKKKDEQYLGMTERTQRRGYILRFYGRREGMILRFSDGGIL
jgi:hypothetical protein